MPSFDLDPLELNPEEPLTLEGPAGTLEARWRPAPAGSPTRGAVVVAHPHPQLGGTMLNKVVFHTARVLNHRLGMASLRFNFRGVGRSSGGFDEGRGEAGDLVSAWAEAARRVPDLPLVAAGYSFGAAMTLRAVVEQSDRGGTLPTALALIAVPVDMIPPPDRTIPALPAVAVHGEADQYTPPRRMREYLEGWPAPCEFRVLPGADHFFEDHLPQVLDVLSETLKRWL